jgi:hypothetical protein
LLNTGFLAILGLARETTARRAKMPYQLVRDDDYPGTGLPVYKVFDADEYQDVTVKHPRAIGEVWSVGVEGVCGKFIPTGVRFQLSGSYAESPVFPAGAYADAARAMIAIHGTSRAAV